MKKIIILIILLIPTIGFSQHKNINYNQTKDIEFAKKYKNYQKIQAYTTKDGMTIKIGDELTIGKAETENKEYKTNDVFKYITTGKTRKTNKEKAKHLSYRNSGSKVIVKDIFVTHIKESNRLWASRKNTPLYVSIYVKDPKKGIRSGNSGVNNYIKSVVSETSIRTILDIEKALKSNEIVNPSAKITKEEALKKLREAKDFLELELITQQEYEKRKRELMKHIKK